MRGVVAFGRYLRSGDTVDIALGMAKAASNRVIAGQPCQYDLRIANVSHHVWNVKVILQMARWSPAQVPDQPSISLAMHCAAPPRHATRLECRFDWRTAPVFLVDAVAAPPDEFWVGEILTLQRYRVRALLCDHTGKQLDHLDIYQELEG
jgi:hypothetical protein